eukprot:g126.t1
MPAAPKAVAPVEPPVEPPVELEQMERKVDEVSTEKKVAPLDGVPKSAPPGCGQMLGRLSARCCGAS